MNEARMPDPYQRLVSTAEVARLLGVRESTVLNKIVRGILPAVVDARGNYRLPLCAVEAYHTWRTQGHRGMPKERA